MKNRFVLWLLFTITLMLLIITSAGLIYFYPGRERGKPIISFAGSDAVTVTIIPQSPAAIGTSDDRETVIVDAVEAERPTEYEVPEEELAPPVTEAAEEAVPDVAAELPTEEGEDTGETVVPAVEPADPLLAPAAEPQSVLRIAVAPALPADTLPAVVPEDFRPMEEELPVTEEPLPIPAAEIPATDPLLLASGREEAMEQPRLIAALPDIMPLLEAPERAVMPEVILSPEEPVAEAVIEPPLPHEPLLVSEGMAADRETLMPDLRSDLPSFSPPALDETVTRIAAEAPEPVLPEQPILIEKPAPEREMAGDRPEVSVTMPEGVALTATEEELPDYEKLSVAARYWVLADTYSTIQKAELGLRFLQDNGLPAMVAIEPGNQFQLRLGPYGSVQQAMEYADKVNGMQGFSGDAVIRVSVPREWDG